MSHKKVQVEKLSEQVVLDSLVPPPNPYSTEEEWLVFHHFDLTDFSTERLQVARERTRLRLLLDPRPDRWFLERLEAIEELIHDHTQAK